MDGCFDAELFWRSRDSQPLTIHHVWGFHKTGSMMYACCMNAQIESQGRWKEAEDLEVQVKETRKRVSKQHASIAEIYA